MTIWELVAQRTRELPEDRQTEVLDFVEFFRERLLPKLPPKVVCGDWADLGFDVTAEDIAEARREMWGDFPKEIR